MNCYPTIAAAPPSTPNGQTTSPLGSPIILLIIMFALMYILMIRPQRKKQKEQEARVASAVKGDKIVSIGGLHGTIHHVGKTTITVKLSENVFVPFEKNAITTVTKVSKGKQKKESEEVERSDDKEITAENRYR